MKMEIDRPADLVLVLLDHATNYPGPSGELSEEDRLTSGLTHPGLKRMVGSVAPDPFPFEVSLNWTEFVDTMETFDNLGFTTYPVGNRRIGLTEYGRETAAALRDALDEDQAAAVRAVIEAHPEEFNE